MSSDAGPRISFASLLLCVCVCSAGLAQEDVTRPDRGSSDPVRVLVFSGTGFYRHPEIPAINGWLARLKSDFELQVDVTETGSDVLSLLDNYDVLVLNNANELAKVLDENQRKKVEDWYAAGGGIVALHAVLVHQLDWPWFVKLGGCDFNSDSLFLEARVSVDPAVRGFGPTFSYSADWTNHDRSITELKGFQVLLRVDESTYEPVRPFFQERGGKAMGEDHPIAWLHENGGGRFFYTELGHDVRSLDTPFGRQHVTEAIRWAAETAVTAP